MSRHSSQLDELIDSGFINSNILLTMWQPVTPAGRGETAPSDQWYAKRSGAVFTYNSGIGAWVLGGSKKTDLVRLSPAMNSPLVSEVIESGPVEPVDDHRIFVILSDVFRRQSEIRTIPTGRVPQILSSFRRNVGRDGDHVHCTMDLGPPEGVEGYTEAQALQIIEELNPLSA